MRMFLPLRSSRPSTRHTAPLLLAAFMAAAAACGSASGSGSVDGDAAANLVTDVFLERALAVESCTHMSGSEDLRVEFAATTACPTSGRRCCLAAEAPTPCPNQPARLCGTGGRFLSERGVILLPDECHVAFEHELIHALLFVNGVPDWRDHTHPAFTCAAPAAQFDG